ncbi:hypothetical protein ACFOWB_06445 [Chenggangzhangella methanolivorans]|uniref:hypothetical protein n=1 Tax=Chenggangzhangella methanolivorans TaxID=1437009 RepID=UPI00361BE92F
MSDAHTIHQSEAPSRRPPAGETTTAKHEVQAKQGTDKPRGMPVVLLVSTVGAAVALWVIWSVFFAAG